MRIKSILMLIVAGACLMHAQTGLQAQLQAIGTKYSIAGMAVAVVKNDSLVYQGCFGQRDVARNLPVDTNTLFRIASISKFISATTLMTMVDQGLCSLDDDVSSRIGFTLRNPNFPAQVITIRKVLSHTASLRDGSGYDNFLSVTASQTPPPQIKSFLVSGGANYNANVWSSSAGPDANYFTYANVDYAVIGTLIEKIGGERFDIAVRNRVLLPLGITGSFNIQDIPNINDVAVLYRKSGGVWTAQTDNYAGVKPSPRNLSGYVIGDNGLIFSPQGGLRISAAELAKFMRMHAKGGIHNGVRILSAAAQSQMITPVWIYNGSNGDNYYGIFNTYGLGSHRTQELLPGETLYGHPGEAYGLISDLYYSKDKNYGIIFMINGGVYGYGTYSGWYNIEEEVYKAALSALPGFLTGTDEETGIIDGYRLMNTYPNPCNPSAVIGFQIPTGGRVTVKVYDALGREIAQLTDEYRDAGKYSVMFDGGRFSSGVYFYELRSGLFSQMKKLTILK